MADILNEAVDTEAEKKRLKDERKKIKDEQKAQKKEAKKRAKEISAQEAELDEEAGGASVFLVTLVIVIIWIAILCLLVKLDVGGFGSNVLAPVLKDVPVVNKILPAESVVSTDDGESYGGYTSLRQAVDYIRELELELEQAQSAGNVSAEELEELKAEVERLQTFEDAQVEFERIKTEFYYEEIDPTTAEYLYKQVVEQVQVNAELEDYAQAFASMEPASAADILQEMTADMTLAAKILNQISADKRGAIMAAMDPEFAARIARIMDPD